MTNVVPFGKYKGKPVELMLSDRDYCSWVSGQDWFRDRYAQIYNIVISGPTEENTCTPEHNELQKLFLLDRYPHADLLADSICGLDGVTVGCRYGELLNWDVVLTRMKKPAGPISWRSIALELKPALGEDYPAVMRKMLQRIKHTRHTAPSFSPCLVYERLTTNSTSAQDISAIFWQNDIHVRSVGQLLDRLEI